MNNPEQSTSPAIQQTREQEPATYFVNPIVARHRAYDEEFRRQEARAGEFSRAAIDTAFTVDLYDSEGWYTTTELTPEGKEFNATASIARKASREAKKIADELESDAAAIQRSWHEQIAKIIQDNNLDFSTLDPRIRKGIENYQRMYQLEDEYNELSRLAANEVIGYEEYSLKGGGYTKKPQYSDLGKQLNGLTSIVYEELKKSIDAFYATAGSEQEPENDTDTLQ